MDANGQVLGHFTTFYSFHTNPFQGFTEIDQCLVVVQLAPECQTSCPCKYGSDGAGTGFFLFLMQAVISCHCSLGLFSFHRFSVGGHQGGGHQAKCTEFFSDGIRLYFPVLVIVGPDKRPETTTLELKTIM